MSNHSGVDPVISGVPYVVTSVDDAQPNILNDFISQAVAAMTVELKDQVVQIHGSAHLVGDTVVVHEKDENGTGKDVRTWSVRMHDRQFIAVQTSL